MDIDITKIKENKIYTCKNDRVFKEVFANEKNQELLKKLLETTLGYEITDITYLNVEKNVDNINLRRKINDLDLDTNVGGIQIEVNAKNTPYVKPRNASYIFDKYSHTTKKGKNYNEDTLIIQLNFSYELGIKEKGLYNVYLVQTIKGKPYIENLFIYEFNMDK